jgi:hypothetical protein
MEYLYCNIVILIPENNNKTTQLMLPTDVDPYPMGLLFQVDVAPDVAGVNALLGALAQEAEHRSALELLKETRQWGPHRGKNGEIFTMIPWIFRHMACLIVCH